MTKFPLVKTGWSNEHFQALLCLGLSAWALPVWIGTSGTFLNFCLMALIALSLDTVLHYIRYKKITCAVSSLVTAAVLFLLTPSVPLYGQLAGVVIALAIGKHTWGGFGKNIFNPALFALLFLSLIFDLEFPVFSSSWILIPAMILCIPFILFRPFAAIGSGCGMIAALLLANRLSDIQLLLPGIIFFCTIVITDPVTVTPIPLAGLLCGFIAGFISLVFPDSLWILCASFLCVNLISRLLDLSIINPRITAFLPGVKKKAVIKDIAEVPYINLSGMSDEMPLTNNDIDPGTILNRIDNACLYGCGGAGFPTAQKIRSVINAQGEEKYFIINGVECDPGLIHDYWLMHQYPGQIAAGIQLVQKLSRFKKTILAVNNRGKYTFKGSFTIHPIKPQYPAGAEQLLIKTLLNKTIPPAAVPAQQGILVLNVQTVLHIYRAVYFNQPADTKWITAVDSKKGIFSVAHVKLSTSVSTLIQELFKTSGPVFTGGGFMQACYADEDALITGKTNLICVSDFPNYKESVFCSGCAFCAAICPVKLPVYKIARIIDNQQYDKIHSYPISSCMECGSCSSVCLAGKNLLSRMIRAKEISKSS